MKHFLMAVSFTWLSIADNPTQAQPARPAPASKIMCQAPQSALAMEFAIRSHVPHYRVTFGVTEVIGWSPLGFDLADGTLGLASEVSQIESQILKDNFTQVVGKRRLVNSEFNEVIIDLHENTAPQRRWQLAMRAYPDGVAFQCRFPKQEGWSELQIASERTQFRLPASARVHALPLNGFTTSYEKRYQVLTADNVPGNSLLGLPMLLQSQDFHAAITEANVNEYAGMYLAPIAGSTTFQAKLSPLPKETKLAVRTPLPHQSPWRVIMVADRAGRLIESDLVLNLSDPCAIKDVSWIKTGKTTFPWWNSFALDGVPFTPGLNTATAKHYVDFCAANGIEYHSLDGLRNAAWYGGKVVPYEGQDPTKAHPEIDLQELLRHAKSKGVRLRLWMHWKAAEAHMAKAFPQFRQWGIEGVMLDFMDRDDQEMNRFIRRAVQLAADNQLTVTLHGCPKPTGLERTYPNLLTHEGVLNLEYNKWDKLGCPPEHQVTVAFTRMLAGPLDFHQGSFRTVAPDSFQPRDRAPFVMGTPCRTLASYVVYQNHLPMVADSPSAYAGHPAVPVLAKIPTTWDDTHVVSESVGEFIAIVRRSGKEFHLGAMTDRQGRTLKVPLKFLNPGRYNVEHYLDADKEQFGLARRDVTVTANDELPIELAPSGGAYVRFTPIAP